MRLTEEILDRVLKNARLEITASEKQALLKDLENILEAFAVIDQAKVEHLEPAYHPLDVKSRIDENVRTDDEPEIFEHVEILRRRLKLNSEGYVWGPKTRK